MTPTDHVIALPCAKDEKMVKAFRALAAVFGSELVTKGSGQSAPVYVISIPGQPDDTMLDLFASLISLVSPFNVRSYNNDVLLGTFVWRPGMGSPEYFEKDGFHPDERSPQLTYSLGLETSYEGVVKAWDECVAPALRTSH